MFTASLNAISKKLILIFISFLFIGYVWFLKETVNGSIALNNFQNSTIKDPSIVTKELNNPYWGGVATTLQYNALMQYENSQGNTQKANEYLAWFEHKLNSNEDPIYYKIILSGYSLLNKKEKYNSLIIKAKKRNPRYFEDLPDQL